ncbi:UPF0721 transmembrane protein [Mesorhizobium sp. L-8-10]|uniref:sulfite exporter TauE/SafE family protein n=1 Tax=unclassified Mesorhizobium TaxID=325217 RepID=UPI0019283366|nr:MULTISPECIES: sulfite exporter TauE/SafE family protein [unclassified Mesorhizobium]BCH22414.1 UPF0721 transmembrane protein [Mesorhizobium sp. L-8-3]BCH30227.1 UPF0721 transmembrane protein [Mesorhizobium sp. L-8-10]
MPALLSDPWFMAVAVAAVILVGLSKGGLGGAMGFVGVPMMALVMSPVQAAAILLPIMVLMDIVSLWTWRGNYHLPTLKAMLPGAMLGIGLGWLTAAVVTVPMIRFIVGVVAIAFVGRWIYQQFRHGSAHVAKPRALVATFWGTVSGFTSFVAHVGGPPFQMYALPLRLEQRIFTGTSVIFFAVTNAVKLVPYFALGQFDATNLTISGLLMPVAPLATLAGAWIVRRMRPDVFYAFSYATVGLIALKLVYDGIFDLVTP